jgi:hypothetical protein
MSAAANAAGYLYAQGRLPVSNLNRQVDAEPKTVLRQGQSQPVKQVRTPRIEYRKRRFYPLPSAA